MTTAEVQAITSPPAAGSAPLAEDVIVGNIYDKYGSRNPVARHLMNGFQRTVSQLAVRARPRTVLEVGCGEGRLANELLQRGLAPESFVASDLSLHRLAPGLDPRIEFVAASIYDLPFAAKSFDLVVCCEVLEHLDEPHRGLRELCRVASTHLLVSTPREPLWRGLNMLRGKYLRDLGNTPGHVQHFSAQSLTELVETEARVVERRNPLPWTMLLATPRTP